MRKAASGELDPRSIATNTKEQQHVLAAHADSKLLSGEAEHGVLRAADSAAFHKFRAAAKKVVVTHEVMQMLQGCQTELRNAQKDYKNGQLLGNHPQYEVQSQSAAPVKSTKARQNEAVAAAGDAATYSLRSIERGKVDMTGAAGQQGATPQHISALPADWGFLRGVDRLQAAPPAAAARDGPAGLSRPDQPYLSYDAATKAAHQAWQPPDDASWRKVLIAKKARQANKAQIVEAEQERAARFIQANWVLYRHRKEQQLLQEQQLAAWAEEQYAAALAGRSTPTPAGDNSTSSEDDSDEEGRRRNRPHPPVVVVQKEPKPIIQPFSRMVGREAPLNTTANTKKWRGAVSGAVAASKLAAIAGAGACGQQPEEDPAGATAAVAEPPPEQYTEPTAVHATLAHGVCPVVLDATGAYAPDLHRTSSSVPLAGGVHHTSSTAAALAHMGSSLLSNITSLFSHTRPWSSSGGQQHKEQPAGVDVTSPVPQDTSSGSGGSAAASKPRAGLARRLSVDLAAFFGGHTAPIPAPAPPAAPAVSTRPTGGLARRLSTDLSAWFGRHPAGNDSGSPAAAHNTPSRRSSRLSMEPGGTADSGKASTGDRSNRCTGEEAPPAHMVPHPPTRRRSVEFVMNLFRRSSIDTPNLPHPAAPMAAEAAAAMGAHGALSTAQHSRWVTAESCEASRLPSPLLSGCTTARTSWSELDPTTSSAVHPDLASRGAAAAAAYLEAASRTAATHGAMMTPCSGVAGNALPASAASGCLPVGAGGCVQQDPRCSRMDCSLSGGVGGATDACRAAADVDSHLPYSTRTSLNLCVAGSSSSTGVQGAAVGGTVSGEVVATGGFDSIWSSIETCTASETDDPSSSTAQQPQPQPQQQQQQHGMPEASLGSIAAGHTANSNSSSRMVQPPAGPKGLGQGEVAFQPGGLVLLTASDITGGSSSCRTPSASTKTKAPVDISNSLLYQGTALKNSASTKQLRASPPPPAAAAAAKGGGVALAASSSLFQPAVPCGADSQQPEQLASSHQPGVTPPAVQLVGSGPTPPPASQTQSPSSPTRQQQQQQQPRAPQGPRDPSSSSSVRPGGPRAHMFARQGGLKSADLAADAAAALAAPPAVQHAEPRAAPSRAESAQTATVDNGRVRPGSAGMSSVSQKLAIARRMAATARVDDDEGDGDGSGLSPASQSLQLDGSTRRRTSSATPGGSVNCNSSNRQHPVSFGSGQLLSKVTGPAAAAAAASAATANGRLLLGVSGRSHSTDMAAPLKPTLVATSGRTAWISESSTRRSPPLSPTGAITSKVSSGVLGRGNPTPAAQHSNAQHRGRGGAGAGMVVLGAAGRPCVEQRPRRNSYSNDGSNPGSGAAAAGAEGPVSPTSRQGAASGRFGAAPAAAAAAAGVGVGGGLRPTSGVKASEQVRRLSVL